LLPRSSDSCLYSHPTGSHDTHGDSRQKSLGAPLQLRRSPYTLKMEDITFGEKGIILDRPQTTRLVDVVLLGPIPEPLTYALPPKWESLAQPGMRVLVPLGGRVVTGCIVAFQESPTVYAPKAVVDVLDEQPALTRDLLALTQWMASYYVATWGETIRTALPRALQSGSVQTIALTAEGRSTAANEARTALQNRILSTLTHHRSLTWKQLQRLITAPGLRSALQHLADEGMVDISQKVAPPSYQAPTECLFMVARRPEEIKSSIQSMQRRAPQQAALLEHVLKSGPVTAAELRRHIPSATQILRALEQKGMLTRGEQPRAPTLVLSTEAAFLDDPEVTLTAAQGHALDQIEKMLHTGEFASVLLHGVTGSGKTEVYMRAMAATLAQGKQVIYLVPEIALTPQLLTRLHARFSREVAVLHSRLTRGERVDEWLRVHRQQASIAIGPRSAIFAPLQRVGLIIVDEEHDPSYKQEEAPRYLARDVAIMRAKLCQAVVVLGSATPALESFTNAQQQRYHYLQLPDRVRTKDLPEVVLIDLRREENRAGSGEVLSHPLRKAITLRMARGEQTLLFLNRRGYATFVQCHECGYICQCPRCSVALTFHIDDRTLKCHYCLFTTPPPDTCPTCRGTRLEYFGTGTQKVEREVRRIFPQARIARMDRDATGGRHAYQDILSRLGRGEIDILIGTQMITKGHDFPRITLVGVVSADVTLGLPDFRAAERTFQLLTQVAGRAGRGEVPGEVIVQTFAPEHYAVHHAQTHDFHGFYAEEIASRKRLGYPPAVRLAAMRFDARDPRAVEQFCQAFVALLSPYVRAAEGVTLLGPAPAALAKLNNRYRWHLLLKAPNARRLHEVIEHGLDALRQAPIPRSGVRFAVDVDPVNLL
jgi:primosomal protein N' (replication factor Y) (superfamily II helicase)